MNKSYSEFQLPTSNRSRVSNLPPHVGGGGQWGSSGDPHNGGQLGSWYGSHIPNYKTLAKAEAEIATSPL